MALGTLARLYIVYARTNLIKVKVQQPTLTSMVYHTKNSKRFEKPLNEKKQIDILGVHMANESLLKYANNFNIHIPPNLECRT